MSVEYSISANKKCRLCLRKTATYISLFEGNFQEMILELTALEISESDNYPKTACISCIDEIQQATKTRRRILECHKRLEQLDLFEKQMNQTEILDVAEFSDESQDICVDMKDEDLQKIFTYNDVNGLHDLVVKTELNDESNDERELASENDPEGSNIELNDKSCTEFTRSIYSKKTFNEKRGHNDKIYTCEDCGENSSNKYAFNLHRMKHRKSTCKMCGIVIRSDNMSKHMECHTSGPRICDLCGVTCKNIESLRGHIFYMHRKAADEYKCDHCTRSFRMKYKLEEHRNKEHIGARNHVCNVCQKKFFTAKDMRSHINMTHKKLRPHVCEHCQKGFSSKYALKTHTRQHTKEAPYKCSQCAEGFRQNISLRTHLKSKHNIEEDKNFPCEFCDKSFVSYFALKVHLRLHSDNNYKCDECSEYFHQKIYLVNHLKNVHSKDESSIDIKQFRTQDYRRDDDKVTDAQKSLAEENTTIETKFL